MGHRQARANASRPVCRVRSNRDPHEASVRGGPGTGWGSQPKASAMSARVGHVPQSSQARPVIWRHSSAFAVTSVVPRRGAWMPYDAAKTEQQFVADPAEKSKPYYRVGIVSRP